MPELPEVETIRLGLQKYLVGHTITSVDVRLPKMVSGEVAAITGAEIVGVRRFGKGLVIDLSNDYSIAIHIKMTGQLIYKGSKAPKETKVSEEKVGGELPNKHTHVIFKLKNQNPKVKSSIQNSKATDAVLYYNDIRQFGWIKILKTNDIASLPFFKELGPEPFKDLTLPVFLTIIKGAKKSPIKPLLMDQKKIAGIGNIYANDALYRSQIHPKRQAAFLTDIEIKKLFAAIEEVMKKGLEAGGASEWQYVNALGQTGNYQNFFQVYNQDKKTCRRCGVVIEKIQFGGRGTFFCPVCQPL